jgi:VanZ family protein
MPEAGRSTLLRVFEATFKHLCRWPFVYYWLPPIAWMGIIFWLSSQPQPFDLPEPLLQTLVSKGGHMLGYAGLSVLWRRALATQAAWPERRVAAMAFLLTVLYAISDEVHQTFVPGRHGSPVDVLIDVAGAALGLGLLRRRQRTRAAKKQPQ